MELTRTAYTTEDENFYHEDTKTRSFQKFFFDTIPGMKIRQQMAYADIR